MTHRIERKKTHGHAASVCTSVLLNGLSDELARRPFMVQGDVECWGSCVCILPGTIVPEETGTEHAASLTRLTRSRRSSPQLTRPRGQPSGEPSVVMGQPGRAEMAQGVTSHEEPVDGPFEVHTSGPEMARP